LLSADAQSGQVSVLTMGGGVRDDLDLPTFAARANGWPSQAGDEPLDALLVGAMEEEGAVAVRTLSALGVERIVEAKRLRAE